MRLVLVFCVLRTRNRPPMTGILPSTGTRDSLSVSRSSIRPPSTIMPPSSTSTRVEMVRLLVTRSVVDTWAAAAAMPEASCSILSRIVSSSVICGVIFRMLPTSLRSMVWNGLTAPPAPPVLVNWPGQERHFLRDLDLRFLVVERDDRRHRDDVGVAVARERAQDRGEVRAAVLAAAAADVKPPGAEVTDDGSWTPRAMSPRQTPAIGVLKSPTRKLSPEPSTTQLTPRSRDASVETSTSMASMITWARRTSSRSTTDIRERMAFGGAVMTSALVSGSAQIVIDLSTPPGAAAPGRGRRAGLRPRPPRRTAP